MPESGNEENPVERAKRKAAAALTGATEDQLQFAEMGIEVEYI